MAIQVLDQSTINQIAAGEVVERPASVVKELMENAIDAGATAVTAEIRDGGIGFIRVTDNGCGIPKEELPTAFLRHSTSKIRTAEDLLTVSSLGFRGEALSSIAAVSQVELITKTADSLTGSRYQIEGGAQKSLEDIGAPDGTTFISRNLFFNTPARRKFLKTAQTEGSHVADLVEKIALSHPEISIRLIVNGQNRLHTSGNHNLKDIIYTVYGREITGNLLPLESESDHIRVHGFIGKPVIARGNRNFENYFINGRYIKSSLISRAIEDGYKSFMMQHKYPFTLLHLTVDPEVIDVNVHPSKMELRFKEGEELYRLISQGIMTALARQELIPQAEIGNSLAEKRPETRETEHPEPFETRRLAAMGASFLKEKPAVYGAGGREGFSQQKPFQKEGKLKGPETSLPGETGTILSRKPERGEEMAGTAGVISENPVGRALERAESFSGAGDRGEWKKVPETSAFHGKNPEAEKTGQPQAELKHPEKREQPKSESEHPEKTEQPQPQMAAEQLEMFDDRLLSQRARYRHRLIGQVFDTYWLVEYNSQLYIIDQHAAHEKVLFERNFASLKSREYTSQMVNPPIILTLSMQEADLLTQNMEIFTKIGFEIEPFGGNEYAVRGVPGNLFSLAKKELLLELLDGLCEDGKRAGSETIYDRIATMSCKAAVKGNNRLSDREANELIDELLTLENPYNCPHGRPTIIAISKYEMEKKFKRIV